jgi:hypothetical protein
MIINKIRIEEIYDRLLEVLEYYNIENFDVKLHNENNSYKIKNFNEEIKNDFINIAIYLIMVAINIVEPKSIDKKDLKEFILENLKKYESALINKDKEKLIQKVKDTKIKEKRNLFYENNLDKNSKSFAIKFNGIFKNNIKTFSNVVAIGIDIKINEEKTIYLHRIDKKH